MAKKLPLKSTLDFLLSNKVDHLSVRQMRILLACSEEKQTVRGLAAFMQVNAPSVCRAAKKLEAMKLLMRQKDPWDHRSVLMSLTPAGHKFANRFE